MKRKTQMTLIKNAYFHFQTNPFFFVAAKLLAIEIVECFVSVLIEHFVVVRNQLILSFVERWLAILAHGTIYLAIICYLPCCTPHPISIAPAAIFVDQTVLFCPPFFPLSLLFLLHRCTFFFFYIRYAPIKSLKTINNTSPPVLCIVRSVGDLEPWWTVDLCCPGAWNSALFPGKGTIQVHGAMQ